jgi:putative transcriptional regulator
VREPQPELPEPGAANVLLIAHPGLRDPNFHKAVLFISNWNQEEGAFGLVLNRPAGRSVSDLLPGRTDLGSLGHLPVYFGGPVARDQLIFASFHWQAQTNLLECRHHVSLDEAGELASAESTTVRAFIGYAGWSKGQLEAELAQHAWLVKPPESELADLQDPARTWRGLIAGFGPLFKIIAEAPDDPSRN